MSWERQKQEENSNLMIMTTANTGEKRLCKVTSLYNNFPIPLNQKHLKLLSWIKIKFSPVSYSQYQRQYIIRTRSAGSYSQGLQRFTIEWLLIGWLQWMTEC